MSTATAPIICGSSGSFDALALELKQMIFKWAATDNTSDIQEELEHDASTKLQAPAINTLIRLKAVSDHIYHQALSYLTSPSFRWVFISHTQPHRYLMRTFRDQVPLEIRRQITHVYIPRVTLYGLIPSQDVDERDWRDFGWRIFETKTAHSDYFLRIGPRHSVSMDDFIRVAKNDIGLGMALLSFALPAITRLDISLDPVECVRSESHRDILKNMDTFSGTHPVIPICMPFLFNLLRRFRQIQNVGQLELRMFWDTFFGQFMQPNWSEEITVKVQDKFISELRQDLPAQSINGHRKAPAID